MLDVNPLSTSIFETDIYPKYSVLFNGYILEDYYSLVKKLLYDGIKIIWFGSIDDCNCLQYDFNDFFKEHLVQVFSKHLEQPFIIVDGEIKNYVNFKNLMNINSDFNSEQYLVEHCSSFSNVVVKASAGTGKTTVMIDRILFLRQVVPNLKLSEIVMITFTNDAANEINRRLLSVLSKRYSLTHNEMYLSMLEEQSQMRISTIHSFELELVKKFGTVVGLSNSVNLESFSDDINKIANKSLNKIVDSSSSVVKQIGGTYYDVRKIAVNFWKKFVQKGYTKEQILNFNWGNAVDSGSFALQNAIKTVIADICNNLDYYKQSRDAVFLDDLQCDLQLILQEQKKTDIGIKYLFIDEFQDTDLSQIHILCKIASWGSYIFVVGDVKQSIYRFRGANESAFEVLNNNLNLLHLEPPHEFILVKNYRTDPNTLGRINDLFMFLGNSDNTDGYRILDYSLPIQAVRYHDCGKMILHKYSSKDSLNSNIVDIIRSSLDDFDKRHENHNDNDEWKPSECVVALVRTNKQLQDLAEICHESNINVVIRKEGSFYQSDAVRDFTAMIGSFIFNKDPVHLYNYLIGPYSGLHSELDIDEIEKLDGSRDKISKYLESLLVSTKWEEYNNLFKMRPFLFVIEKILCEIPVVELSQRINYTKKRNERYWDDEELQIELHNESVQYRADLEKLLTIIEENAGSDYFNLYGLYNYLKLQVSTNTEEPQQKPDGEIRTSCLYCMTVHASKGLEFDTVILPYTTTPSHYRIRPICNDVEILYIDETSLKVGWKCKKSTTLLSNEFFIDLDGKEEIKDLAENTRLMYVAMTRAVNNLHVLIPNKAFSDSWSYWIKKWDE